MAIAGGGGIAFLLENRTSDANPVKVAVKSHSPAMPVPDLQDPAEDFQTFLYVLETGGCEITRPAAIAWLDRYTGEHLALPEDQVARLMAMIVEGGHPTWEKAYRQHLFNSTFNALHLCHAGEPFTRALQQLALHDTDSVMRLYALQHLGMQRRVGHLTGALADEIHVMLETLAQEPAEEVSGTAIQVLASWDGADDAEQDPATLQLALATAADTSRSVDIRVTAIHAAGSASLPLARKLAVDAAQPVMLRKASIARIGQHGDVQDLASLTALAGESTRLAQAAEPAQAAIRNRLDHPSAPKPVPY